MLTAKIGTSYCVFARHFRQSSIIATCNKWDMANVTDCTYTPIDAHFFDFAYNLTTSLTAKHKQTVRMHVEFSRESMVLPMGGS